MLLYLFPASFDEHREQIQKKLLRQKVNDAGKRNDIFFSERRLLLSLPTSMNALLIYMLIASVTIVIAFLATGIETIVAFLVTCLLWVSKIGMTPTIAESKMPCCSRAFFRTQSAMEFTFLHNFFLLSGAQCPQRGCREAKCLLLRTHAKREKSR